MNKKEKSSPSPKRANIVLSAVGVILILVLFAWCMVFLAQKGFVSFPWLKTKNGEQGTAEVAGNTVPSIEPSSAETTNWFNTVNTKNLLKGLTERDSYVRTVRIARYDGNVRHTEELRIMRDGERWRAESDERLLISDGENLYVRIGSEEGIYDADADSFSRETGLASTASLLNDPNKKDMVFSADGTQLTITTEDKEAGLSGEYIIMIESGLVFSETVMLNGQRIRTVQTEALDVFGVDSLDSDTFTIPQLNGGSYE